MNTIINPVGDLTNITKVQVIDYNMTIPNIFTNINCHNIEIKIEDTTLKVLINIDKKPEDIIETPELLTNDFEV